MNLSEFSFDFERLVTRDATLKALQAIEHLLGAIQEGYYEVMVGSRGAAGSVGALQTQLQIAEALITSIIAFGKNGKYLQYTEYGVQPASPEGYPAYTTIPPVKNFVAWIRRARIPVDEKYKPKHKRQSSTRRRGATRTRTEKNSLSDDDKARLRMAWAMVVHRRRFGYKGLHVIAAVVKAQEAAIRQILEGRT